MSAYDNNKVLQNNVQYDCIFKEKSSNQNTINALVVQKIHDDATQINQDITKNNLILEKNSVDNKENDPQNCFENTNIELLEPKENVNEKNKIFNSDTFEVINDESSIDKPPETKITNILSDISNFVTFRKYRSTGRVSNTPQDTNNEFSLMNFSLQEFNTSMEESYKKVSSSVQTNLNKWRDFIADFQFRYQGVNNQDILTFGTLLFTISEAVGKFVFSLFNLILNLLPIFEVFIYIIRFLFDSIISLSESNNFTQVISKIIILIFQLISIYISMYYIFDFIVIPFINLIFSFISKLCLF